MPKKTYWNDPTLSSEEKVQFAFNDAVGVVMSYLDDEGVGGVAKRVIKERIYALCDEEMKPLVENLSQEIGQGPGQGDEDEGNFNR